MTKETIEIKTCPLCGKSHRYRLSVGRSPGLFGKTLNTKALTPKVKRVRRLFICPKRNDLFETILEIAEDAHYPITSVRVDGIVEEQSDE